MTIRHLTYHIYAARHHDGWQWNLQQLARRAVAFNGKRILSVAVDHASESAETVVYYLSNLDMEFTKVIVLDNDPVLREVIAWPQVLEALQPQTASPNEVVFTAHSKGVSYAESGNQLRNWADLMYQACLDNISEVDASLRQNIATGAFRRIGNFWQEEMEIQATHPHWHYSGTFFWWKLAEMGRRDFTTVDQHRWGLEAWIGKHCRIEESGCLFLDNCDNLYDAEYWSRVVWPAWQLRRG